MKATKPLPVKKNVRAKIIRANLATSLAAFLPSKIFQSVGFVHEIQFNGARVRVSFGADSFWFDGEAVEICPTPSVW